MFLKSLYLRNFRNYAEAEVFFSPKVNLITGDNAQGKTNLIEAIYLLTTGRSFRTNHLKDLIKQGENFFFLEAIISKNQIEQKIQIAFDGKTKKLTLDSSKYGTFQHLLGILPSVLYLPQDIELIDGSPTIRRRFFNLHLAQRDPLYIHHFMRYWKAMKQRNALLKTKILDSIECWEAQMDLSATYLTKSRKILIDSIQSEVESNSRYLSSEKEIHRIEYLANTPENYLIQLQKNRLREQYLGTTLMGPHRDDFLLKINEFNAKGFASEGQKKTASFALRLSEWDIFFKIAQISPLFCIDDLSVHLDSIRQKHFSERIGLLGQVFITSPHPIPFIREATIHPIPLKNRHLA